MNARYAFTILLPLTITLQAQNLLDIKDEFGTVVNGETVTVYDLPTAFEMSASLLTNLNGPASKTVNLKRYEIGPLVSGTYNYFCWGVCYIPRLAGVSPLWVSVDPVIMAPGVDMTNFHGYYRPMGTTGVSTFRYVWYDEAAPSDTAWVDIVFDTQHVGFAEQSQEASFIVYPDPAVGGEVFIESRTGSGSDRDMLLVFNAIGERVIGKMLSAGNASERLSVSNLPDGMYFLSLERNGRPVATRRLVVASH